MSNTHYQAVILDEASFNADDLDLTPLLQCNEAIQWQSHANTPVSDTEDKRQEYLAGKHIAVLNKVRLAAKELQQLPDLKLILLTATGMDNIDVEYCNTHDISVRNVTDYCTPSVTQHVFTLILALKRNLIAYHQHVTDGAWSDSDFFTTLDFPVHDLYGQTIGLIGYGALARGVETIAKAFGMKVLIAESLSPHNTRKTDTENTDSSRTPLTQLLNESDIVSLHCPLTAQTRELINAETLQHMKPSTILINTARGALIDNQALAVALENRHIAGAGIDVLEQEPPPASHPLIEYARKENANNILITPHIAWASRDARQLLIEKVANNLQDWLNENHG